MTEFVHMSMNMHYVRVKRHGCCIPDLFLEFLVSNTICFFASLSICLILVSGIRLEQRLFTWLLSLGMWVTLTAFAYSYAISLAMITPDLDFSYRKTQRSIIQIILARLDLYVNFCCYMPCIKLGL